MSAFTMEIMVMLSNWSHTTSVSLNIGQSVVNVDNKYSDKQLIIVIYL